MGCGSSQSASVVPQETDENSLNEASENGKKYRKFKRITETYIRYPY